MTVPPAPAAADAAATSRADRQRERILRAARSCFVRHGFHAAAMADIASAAEMSPGLIYRYFPGKNAIVSAIIDLQVDEARRSLDKLGSTDDLVGGILDAFERWCLGGDDEMAPALFLEMVAVAARDPAVAGTLRAADAAIRDRLLEVLRRTGPQAGATGDPAELGCRVAMLQCLIEGLIVRSVRQPDLDRRLLRACLERALGTTSPASAAACER